ncbi:MAG: hypothetical protein K0S37_764 [Microbacterium sp.]|jgi:hypothetical protein|nr:hypothetical protein [Microbacterium sp.]
MFNAEIDQNAAAAAEESASRQGSGDFGPLPKGRYQAIVTENRGVESVGGSGANANKQTVRLRVDILPDSPTGAGRVFFFRVPLFSRWAPNDKNPEGAPAWVFWNFFEKVMGVTREEILAGKGLPSNVEGKRLTIVLGKPRKPDENNLLGSSEVDDVDGPEQDYSKTPVLPAGVAVAPWLTPDGALIPNHPSLTPKVAPGAGAPGLAPGGPGLAPVTPIGPGVPGVGGIAPGGYPAPGAIPGAIPGVQPGVAGPGQWGVAPQGVAGQPGALQGLAAGAGSY